MFGLFKPSMAPEGPARFSVGADIQASAATVYSLLDWSDPRNAKRQLGHSVEALGTDGDRFRLVMTGMPGHVFDFTVKQTRPRSAYAFDCEISPQVGKLRGESESYTITSDGEGSCTVELTVDALFEEGLTTCQFEQEVATMTLACLQSLGKLKLHAEEGADAVRTMEAAQYS